MSGIQKDLGSKGFQALAGTIDGPAPVVRDFVERFNPTFPVGVSDRITAAAFMQLSPMVKNYVPYVAIIDRTGMIRQQYTGGDPFLVDESKIDENFRAAIAKLLGESAKAPGKASKRTGTKNLR